MIDQRALSGRWRASAVWACVLVALAIGCGGANGGSNGDAGGNRSDGRADAPAGNDVMMEGMDGGDHDVAAVDDSGGAMDGSSGGRDGGTVESEVCFNGVDDNANGRVDEGCACLPGETQRCYTGRAANAGVGACAWGMQRCVGTGEFGAFTDCEGATLPGPEYCDSVDNDCDGVLDNGCECRPMDTRGCYTGPAATRGIGACRDGTQTCTSGPGGVGSTWGRCAGEVLPASEVCDGIDNDCDGTVDNGCACRPGETRACYGGPMGTAGVGPCRAGTQTCDMSGGGWGVCSGQVLPGAEVCDGQDNDCDGVIDDGCTCTIGATRACYSGPMGTRGVGLCRDGSQTCVAGPGGVGSNWDACTGDTLPATESCDDLDNDCDGVIDDGCTCRRGETRSCYTGPSGTAGVGACAPGAQSCVVSGGTASWGACMGQRTPSDEICDGVDNDCNGTVDNGCDCVPGDIRSCYPGPAGTGGVGVCAMGTQTCESGPGGVGSAWGTCTGYTLPGTESCNATDDDCDGMIDEGCTCTSGMTRACYGGPPGTEGVGPCRSGTQSCVVSGGTASWSSCMGEVRPSAETCDGIDNDCNGTVDNGCDCTPGTTRACYTGPAGTQGVGICRAGSQTCVSGSGGVGSAWGSCSGQTLPGTETCNGLDDNCDGRVDEAACGPSVMCPAPITALAGDTVMLTASASGATSYAWSVIASPAGATWTFGSPSSPSTTFTSVIVGVYTIQFTATDAMGRTASCTTTVTLQAHGLRVEMVWTTPDDVDLHLHNAAATAWRSAPNDCYFANRTPSWGTGSTADDPALDTDDTDGYGPENIRIDSPQTSETYTVGAHYWRATASSSNVTIRIYCGTTLMATYMRTLRPGPGGGSPDSNDFWRVARVRFTSPSACTITPINDVITGAAASSGNP